MKLDERKPLNRETVTATLMRKKKAELILTAVMGGFTVLLLLIATGNALTLLLLPAVFALFIPTLRFMHLVRKESFSIREAELIRVEEVRRGRSTRYLYDFGPMGKFLDDHRPTRDLAVAGECLYIVVLHGTGEQIVGLYHPLLYRLTK